MAKVSILMNAYNAEKYLKEAVDSIYAQTYEDWEIIFVDNCSTDSTKKIIDSYDNKIKYYKTNKNIPLGAARNFGLQFCNSEYLAFLDTDDIWLDNKLQQQIDVMEHNSEYTMCYTGVDVINEKGQKIGHLIPKANSGNVFAQQLVRYEINMQTVLLRNDANIKINEQLRHSPDFDLFMGIASNSKVYVIKTSLVKYRKTINSLTSKNIEFWWQEMKFTLDKLFNNNELKEKYHNTYQFSYAKVAYYKACFYMHINKKEEASFELSRYKYLDFKYFFLYIISLMPICVWHYIHKYK